MINQVQKGFTLIELMIVVAIIGILAAVGLPAYQDYTIRAQVSEGPIMGSSFKTAMSEWYSNKGTWPTSSGVIGLPSQSGTYTSSVYSIGNVITVEYGNQAHANIQGSTLLITGSPNATGGVQWDCTVGNIDQKYVPSSCK